MDRVDPLSTTQSLNLRQIDSHVTLYLSHSIEKASGFQRKPKILYITSIFNTYCCSEVFLESSEILLNIRMKRILSAAQ